MKRLLLLFDLFGLVGFFGAMVSVREVVYVCICGALWFIYFFKKPVEEDWVNA